MSTQTKSPYYQGFYAGMKYGGRNPFDAETHPEEHDEWDQGYEDGSEEAEQDDGCDCAR